MYSVLDMQQEIELLPGKSVKLASLPGLHWGDALRYAVVRVVDSTVIGAFAERSNADMLVGAANRAAGSDGVT
jgi:hypothetical protein